MEEPMLDQEKQPEEPDLRDELDGAGEDLTDDREEPINAEDAPPVYNLLRDEDLADRLERSLTLLERPLLLYELNETEERRDAITAALSREPKPPGELAVILGARREVMQERCKAITEHLWPVEFDVPEPEEEQQP